MSKPAPRPNPPPERPIAGIIANATAFAATSTGDAMTKLVVMAVPAMQALALRGIFLLVLLAPFFIRVYRRGEPIFATRHPGLHIIRSVIQIVSIVTFFLVMQKLAFTTVISIMLMTPLFAALSSIVLVGERIRLNQAGAIVMGLVGCLIIVNPRGVDTSWWTVIAVLSSATWGVSQCFVRLLSRTESQATILAWSNAAFVSTAILLSLGHWQPVEPIYLLAILAMSSLQFVSQWFSTLAFRIAPVATVAPMQYSQMFWAAFYGFLIWHEWPATHVWFGAALVIAGGVWLVRGEGRRLAGK